MERIKREEMIALAIENGGIQPHITAALRKGIKPKKLKYVPDCIVIGDENYPHELYQLDQPPYVLFYKGNPELIKKRKISIVGSRLMNEYAEQVTAEVAEKLSGKYIIVSGMARGTDCVAQSNAILSIGVLAHGLDWIYPRENAFLFDRVAKNGLLISEYPAHIRPQKHYFPFRNRIIVALGKALIVPCARKTGGTMTSVAEALKLQKEIYTIPYPLNTVCGEGCNRLIEEGANMILDIDDLGALD